TRRFIAQQLPQLAQDFGRFFRLAVGRRPPDAPALGAPDRSITPTARGRWCPGSSQINGPCVDPHHGPTPGFPGRRRAGVAVRPANYKTGPWRPLNHPRDVAALAERPTAPGAARARRRNKDSAPPTLGDPADLAAPIAARHP